MAALVAAVLLVCLGATVVAPASNLGQAMSSPWAVICLIPWMAAVGWMGAVVAAMLRWQRVRKGG
jgi:hypothetical protein